MCIAALVYAMPAQMTVSKDLVAGRGWKDMGEQCRFPAVDNHVVTYFKLEQHANEIVQILETKNELLLAQVRLPTVVRNMYLPITGSANCT